MPTVFGILLCLICHGQGNKPVHEAGPPPAVIRHDGVDVVLWYSAENIEIDASSQYFFRTTDGKKKSLGEALGPLTQLRLEQYMADVAKKAVRRGEGVTDCPQTVNDSFHFSQPVNLESMIENTQLAMLGEVEAITPGFFYDKPASLLTVRVNRILKDQPGVRPHEYYHFSYLNTRFKLGDLPVCNENALFDFPAWKGMKFLIFMWPAIEAEAAVVFTSPHYVFAERPDGTVRFPKWLLDKELRDIKKMDVLVERLLARMEGTSKKGD